MEQSGEIEELPDDPEGQIIRHTEPTKQFEPALGDSETIEAISEHISKHLGPVKLVFHEIVSDIVHIDVHWVAPRPDRPFHTLVTTGMSDRSMDAPPGAEGREYAELMAFLPPDWRLGRADLEDERWYWPVRWLKILARFPHQFDTWLWEWHTVPNGDPPEPFAANTRLSGVMLMTPQNAPPEFAELVIGDKTIHFFALMPLYAEEMSHKLKHGAETLLPRFRKHGITDLVDVDRPNVCKKRFLFF
ncbi:MAG: suppressor of fused domain protein [Phycisphaerales bacterium]|nr:suppressor of fused domain protein [Phycisphaerales bacterium]